MVIKINLRNAAIVLIILSVILTMSAVSAEDINSTVNNTDAIDSNQDTVVQSDVTQDENVDNSTVVNKNASFSKNAQTTYIKDKNFYVKLLDENSTALVNKTVHYTINGKTLDVTTNKYGNAIMPLNVSKGTYTVGYSFDESGYNPISGSSKIIVITDKTSKFKASAYTAYVGLKNTYTVTLTVDGIPLANRQVSFTIHGVTYKRTTNSKGQASLAIGLKKGVYPIKFSYAGETNIKKASGQSKVTVKKGMPITIAKANSVIYRHKTLGQFKVKLTDARGNLIKNKTVKFLINKVTYTRKTDDNGIATLNICMKKGSYSMVVTSTKTSVYSKASKTYTVKIKPSYARNNGVWLLGRDMNNVNLDSLKKVGTKQIILNAKAIELWGQSAVEKFIKKANDRGIKVHIWVQVFYYDGKWHNPVKDDEINYDLINSRIKLAKKFANIKGVGGIHFDYLRYPGTAYKYSQGVNAINYFTKSACEAVREINPNITVSAAVMPEPSSMKYYYGQDIDTMTKYLDVIVPMVYKGNYNKGTSWIQKVTETFVKKSSGAQVWTGLMAYKSDSNPVKLSASALMNDADAAALAGARGVILFRWGIANLFNFNNI